MKLDPTVREILAGIGQSHGTPCYVYFIDHILAQIYRVMGAFDNRFTISYAVKANPNPILLNHLKESISLLDVSSAGEMSEALTLGYKPEQLSFTGPAKREFELIQATQAGSVEMICESEQELDRLNQIAEQFATRIPILIRINPDKLPKTFGVNMAARPSQFGIDQVEVSRVLERLTQWTNLDFAGFHIYAGTNCLNEDAISENFANYIELFLNFSEKHQLHPRKLIFGSGFGIPYFQQQQPLDLKKLANLINPAIDDLHTSPFLKNAQCVLETGRFLVGQNGYFVTSVISEKTSRGVQIRLCDGGMNNHLGACGLLGMVIRRNYPIWNLNNPTGPLREYMLVGPLCTTIDTIAERIELPEIKTGDTIAIGSSGAYGLTASPVRFISHPQPNEFIVSGTGLNTQITDVSQN
ncbi:MAG: hypothetical protein V3U75_05820 [Methylococcaceae bacterium]